MAAPTVAFDENPSIYLFRLASSDPPRIPISTDCLPAAPLPAIAMFPQNVFSSGTTVYPEPKYARVILAGQLGTRLSFGNKVVLGARSAISLNSGVKAVLGAGYSHIRNGQPNYGVDSTAFAQRVGASAARSASQDIFTKSVMAPILHQDPRYYVLGPNVKLLHRLVYAATRPLITRTDSGHQTVNTSLLIGYAGASALTRTYYPQINQNSTDEFKEFGTSLAGSAIGFVFDEFADRLLRAVHMRH